MDSYPPWLVITLAILGAVGTFWKTIKSTVEKIFKGKHEITLKKVEQELSELERLKKRVALLEDRNLQLVKANTALSTAISFMIDEYASGNPENEVAIANLKNIIEVNAIHEHEADSSNKE